MLKLLGAIMAAAGCAGLGLSRDRQLREGVRTLDQLIRGLALLEGELALRCQPLPQLLEGLARRCSGTAGQLFAACALGLDDPERAAFSAVWAGEVDGLEGLSPEGRDLLRPLGQYLGRYETARQCGFEVERDEEAGKKCGSDGDPKAAGAAAGAGGGELPPYGPGLSGPGGDRRGFSDDPAAVNERGRSAWMWI